MNEKAVNRITMICAILSVTVGIIEVLGFYFDSGVLAVGGLSNGETSTSIMIYAFFNIIVGTLLIIISIKSFLGIEMSLKSLVGCIVGSAIFFYQKIMTVFLIAPWLYDALQIEQYRNLFLKSEVISLIGVIFSLTGIVLCAILIAFTESKDKFLPLKSGSTVTV